MTEVARHDNLSAATHELRETGGRALTKRWEALLDHYGMRSTRIQPGKGNENGVAEHRHYRLKTAIDQGLIVRGSRDFDSREAYEAFLGEVVAKLNRRAAAKLEEPRPAPPARRKRHDRATSPHRVHPGAGPVARGAVHLGCDRQK